MLYKCHTFSPTAFLRLFEPKAACQVNALLQNSLSLFFFFLMDLVLLEETADSRIRARNTGDEPGTSCSARKSGNAKNQKEIPALMGVHQRSTGAN